MPKFGDIVFNPLASPDNPHRTGTFVRVIHRNSRGMNPGKWWEVTDGNGSFWMANPETCTAHTPEPAMPVVEIDLAEHRHPHTCCDLHKEAGCCDPDDCGPCCPACPTCPSVRAGNAPADLTV